MRRWSVLMLGYLGLFLVVGAASAQTTQRIRTSSKEYGSSIRAGILGGSSNRVQVGTSIPYASLNGGESQRSALLNGGSSGLQAAPNVGNGFGVNPLLGGGPVISQPNLPMGPAGAALSPVLRSRPQAYNPYSGQVYDRSKVSARGTRKTRNSSAPSLSSHSGTSAMLAPNSQGWVPTSKADR